ncbi:MAG: hypothetical protein AB7L84_10790 [Acidimicrobiia bacterium]
MPWCEGCERFYNPNSLNPDGTCRACGRQVGEARPEEEAAAARAQARAPWHFKLLVGATAVYLGWRLVQGVEWVIHHV